MLKIAVVGSFSAAAALTFAPLAAADDLTSILDTEISGLNDIFTVETDLAGVPSTDITAPTTGDPFDTITGTTDISAVQGAGQDVSGDWVLNSGVSPTEFDYLVYGVDPTAAGLSPDPGSYDVFNGALVEFADALNVELYSLENNGALDTTVGDFIGSPTTIADALATGNATDAAEYFLQYGLGDLSGFLDIDIASLLGSL
jgi:hypothetical protein